MKTKSGGKFELVFGNLIILGKEDMALMHLGQALRREIPSQLNVVGHP